MRPFPFAWYVAGTSVSPDASVTTFTQGSVEAGNSDVNITIAEKTSGDGAKLLLTDPTNGAAKVYTQFDATGSDHLTDAVTTGKLKFITASVTVSLDTAVYTDATYYIAIKAATINDDTAIPVRITKNDPSTPGYVGVSNTIWLKIQIENNKFVIGEDKTKSSLTKDIYLSATGLANVNQTGVQITSSSFDFTTAVQKNGEAPSGENVEVLDCTQ